MWAVELRLEADHDGTTDDLKGILLAAYTELRGLDGVIGHDMWSVLAEDLVTFQVVVADEDPAGACTRACSAVRTALHAAGAATPGWDTEMKALIAALARPRVTLEPVPA